MTTPPMLTTESTLQNLVMRTRLATSRRLVTGMIALIILGALPALVDLVEHGRAAHSVGVARWAVVALALAVVQLAYAVLLFQVPDWSSLWVVAIVMLLVAMLDAMTLGLTLVARPESPLIQWFELGDVLRSSRARIWSLAMTSGSSLLALACGVTAVRWRNQIAEPAAPLPGASGQHGLLRSSTSGEAGHE